MHYIVIVYKFILIPTTVICFSQEQQSRIMEAITIASDIFVKLKTLYENCFETAMPNQRKTKRNTFRIRRKEENESVLMGTEYLDIRFPGSPCLPCYIRDTGKTKKNATHRSYYKFSKNISKLECVKRNHKLHHEKGNIINQAQWALLTIPYIYTIVL